MTELPVDGPEWMPPEYSESPIFKRYFVGADATPDQLYEIVQLALSEAKGAAGEVILQVGDVEQVIIFNATSATVGNIHFEFEALPDNIGPLPVPEDPVPPPIEYPIFRFEAWPTLHKQINQPFGARPEVYAQYGLPGHEGIDVQAFLNESIFAVASGEISEIHPDPDGHNYGRFVRVKHAEDYETTYAHLSTILVEAGQQVGAGQAIGRCGISGNTSGAHLHLTLKKLDEVYSDSRGEWPHHITDPTSFLKLDLPIPDEPIQQGRVIPKALNVRAAPVYPGSEIVGTVAEGAIVYVLAGPDNGWLKIVWDNSQGFAFVSANYIELL